MTLEAVAAVISAVLGSTGLAGLITGVVQLSRASRLKKAVHEMAEILKVLDAGTAEHGAAKYALKILTLDLVAARTVRVGARTWWKVLGVVLVFIVIVAVFGQYVGDYIETVGPQALRALLLLAASYVMLAVGGFLFLFTRRRERLVAHALDEDVFLEDTVLLASPPLQSAKRRLLYEEALRNEKGTTVVTERRGRKRAEFEETPDFQRAGAERTRTAKR